jgi:4'-phosphopantetheinyl transferase EntD
MNGRSFGLHSTRLSASSDPLLGARSPLSLTSMTDVAGLGDLFSAAVRVAESRDESVDETKLWPEEREAVGEVVDGRWWDWVMGRRCARMAVEDLGLDATPILPGHKRQPLWPAGVVGAITHTRGYVAAAVADAGTVMAVGIDAEPDEPLPHGVITRVASPEERAMIGAGRPSGVDNLDRLLFSAKESIYKAWFPLAGIWLGFLDARLEIDPDDRTFHAEILIDGPISTVSGRYASVDGVLMTAIELPHA